MILIIVWHLVLAWFGYATAADGRKLDRVQVNQRASQADCEQAKAASTASAKFCVQSEAED